MAPWRLPSQKKKEPNIFCGGKQTRVFLTNPAPARPPHLGKTRGASHHAFDYDHRPSGGTTTFVSSLKSANVRRRRPNKTGPPIGPGGVSGESFEKKKTPTKVPRNLEKLKNFVFIYPRAGTKMKKKEKKKWTRKKSPRGWSQCWSRGRGL